MNLIKFVDGVIFDCDGVLIDASKSYDKTIQITVNYILSQILGFSLPEDLITMNIIHRFRESGGFNNDWDTTYIILLYIFSKLPQNFQRSFTNIYKNLLDKSKKPKERLIIVSSHLREIESIKGLGININELRDGLLKFAEKADSSGIDSLERLLNGEALSTFKEFLNYPNSIGESLITTFFEEAYLGSEIFERVYGIKPKFWFDKGMIENEELIIKEETLIELTNLFGEGNLGIVSGRGYYATQKTLGKLMDYFNPKAMVFTADDLLKKSSFDKELAKPSPYPLLKAANCFHGKVIYVGNSTEDLLMEERANKIVNKFLFASVCNDKERLEFFLNKQVDIALHSVNQLPKVLRWFRV